MVGFLIMYYKVMGSSLGEAMEMRNTIPTEKLDRNNFASWEYKMH